MLEKKILIAGAHGMVGRALVRALKGNSLLTPTRSELDCTDQRAVREYLRGHEVDCVIIAAAKVGGIHANNIFPAEFLYENLMIASNLIHESHEVGINRLLFLGSSCIYPRSAPQPIKEEMLLTSPLEPTNEAYALAKIAGVKLCQYYSKQYGRKYISAMPTNLYGHGDNYHPTHSHVIPGLIRRFHEAKVQGKKEVEIWGTGQALREFLYVDDLAEGCLHVLKHYFGHEPINIGSGQECTIRELAELISQVIGYQGDVKNDLTKPDGTPRKLVDTTKMAEMGWLAKTPLKEGLERAYADFLQQIKTLEDDDDIREAQATLEEVARYGSIPFDEMKRKVAKRDH